MIKVLRTTRKKRVTRNRLITILVITGIEAYAIIVWVLHPTMFQPQKFPNEAVVDVVVPAILVLEMDLIAIGLGLVGFLFWKSMEYWIARQRRRAAR